MILNWRKYITTIAFCNNFNIQMFKAQNAGQLKLRNMAIKISHKNSNYCLAIRVVYILQQI